MNINLLISKLFSFKKHSLKILSIAIIVLNIPIINLIDYFNLIYFDVNNPVQLVHIVIFVRVLSAILLIIIFNSLLKPFFLTKEYVNNYTEKHEIGELPKFYEDEIGIFMSNITNTIMSLDELVTEKQDLIALMSHDLKNPLSAVINYTEMIDGDEKNLALKYKIQSAAFTQKVIIDNVLELLEFDSLLITEKELDIVDLEKKMNKLIDRYSFKQIEKNIKIKLEINSKTICAKRDLIEQVFENVYSNALKFTENGTIKIISEDIEGNMVRITFKDTGLGFANEIGEKLFDRFTVYKRKGTRDEATTGLGLYLSKKIITKHKGTIEAFSEGKGMGAKFIITLPTA
jgi:signal transduction histidine kinase